MGFGMVAAGVGLGLLVGAAFHLASWELRARWPRQMAVAGLVGVAAWIGALFYIRTLAPQYGLASLGLAILWVGVAITALIIGGLYVLALRRVPWYQSLVAGFVEAPLLLGSFELIHRTGVWGDISFIMSTVGLTFLVLTLLRACAPNVLKAGRAGAE